MIMHGIVASRFSFVLPKAWAALACSTSHQAIRGYSSDGPAASQPEEQQQASTSQDSLHEAQLRVVRQIVRQAHVAEVREAGR